MRQEAIVSEPAPGAVRCVPVPGWVEHRAYLAAPPEGSDAYVANGVCRLLHDTQVDLAGAEHAWHLRSAKRVLTRAGAEAVAHFVAEFDPAFQRLDVHFIRIRRGDETIDHARPGAIQTFRRETNLERLMLNGRLTASLLIPDVRVDDIVEVALTTYGRNPALSGKYSAAVWFDCFNPWLEWRHRLVRPLTREIVVEGVNHPPAREARVEDGVETSCWSLVAQPQQEREELAPPWLIQSPGLQFSEYASWGEVARLFAPRYRTSLVPEPLAAEIDALAAAHPDPAARAAEWLRFVQQKLRYFALALGEGGLIPRPVDEIWASRLGDCKDATELYLAGARRLGLEACAALVSTTHGPVLGSLLPSPEVFNHCIVRVRVDGATCWLDPTCQTQSGSLDNIFFPHTGWALPLTPDTERLERLPAETPLHFLDCEEEVQFDPRRDSPARLTRRFKYLSSAADAVRNRIANQGGAGYAKEMLKALQGLHPGIVEAEPLQIADEPARSSLTVTFAYELPDCWKPVKHSSLLIFATADMVVSQDLALLKPTPRQAAIYLARPRRITHSVRLTMPCAWAGPGVQQERQAPGVRYRNSVAIEGRTLTSAKELTIDAWTMPAEQARAYSELVGKLRDNVLGIQARERFGKIVPPAGAPMGLGRGLAVVVVWLLLGALFALLQLANLGWRPVQTYVPPVQTYAPPAPAVVRPDATQDWLRSLRGPPASGRANCQDVFTPECRKVVPPARYGASHP